MPRGADGNYYQDWSRSCPGLDDGQPYQGLALLSDPAIVRKLVDTVKERRQRFEQLVSQTAATYSVAPDQVLRTCINVLIQNGDIRWRGFMYQRGAAEVNGQRTELPFDSQEHVGKVMETVLRIRGAISPSNADGLQVHCEEAVAILLQEEAEERRKSDERLEVQRKEKERQRRELEAQRRREHRCFQCGHPLGWWRRLWQRDHHAACDNFRPDDPPPNFQRE